MRHDKAEHIAFLVMIWICFRGRFVRLYGRERKLIPISWRSKGFEYAIGCYTRASILRLTWPQLMILDHEIQCLNVTA
jgi:hypothetical protein